MYVEEEELKPEKESPSHQGPPPLTHLTPPQLQTARKVGFPTCKYAGFKAQLASKAGRQTMKGIWCR
jgi:hypothetical protein